MDQLVELVDEVSLEEDVVLGKMEVVMAVTRRVQLHRSLSVFLVLLGHPTQCR